MARAAREAPRHGRRMQPLGELNRLKLLQAARPPGHEDRCTRLAVRNKPLRHHGGMSSGNGLATEEAFSVGRVARLWRSHWLQLVLQVIGLALAAVLIARVALAAAAGAVRVGPGPTFETEFIHVGWWFASLVLCVPLGFFARKWWRLAPCALATLAVTAPQFWAFDVMLDRYAASGWSQGTEFLGIVIPLALTLSFLAATVIGTVTSPARRANRPKAAARL